MPRVFLSDSIYAHYEIGKKIQMTRLTTLLSAMVAVAFLLVTAGVDAGLLGCGCSHGPAHYAPVVSHNAPTLYSDPGIDVGCDCASVASSCCGVGGGLAQIGNLYGSAEVYGGNFGGGQSGSVDPRSFQSGFESLPNMDGGGTHHRLPFHSYRRPWAHPGIADNNINIVW